MRKFWMIVGGAYVFFHRNKRTINPLLVIALVVIQFSLLLFLGLKMTRIEGKIDEERKTTLEVLNRVYSQVWQLNSRVNAVMDQSVKK